MTMYLLTYCTSKRPNETENEFFSINVQVGAVSIHTMIRNGNFLNGEDQALNAWYAYVYEWLKWPMIIYSQIWIDKTLIIERYSHSEDFISTYYSDSQVYFTIIRLNTEYIFFYVRMFTLMYSCVCYISMFVDTANVMLFSFEGELIANSKKIRSYMETQNRLYEPCAL